MTLDDAFALVKTNALTWHGLHEDRGQWYVRLRTMATHSGMAAYGFGQHLELPEAIRQAIMGAKEWETWRPSAPLPAPAFGAKAKALAESLGLTDEDIIKAIIEASK